MKSVVNWRRALLTATMIWLPSCVAFGQTVVHVNDGQTLTEPDLLAGVFNGQSFSLSPDTTFEVNSGGTIARLPEITGGPAFDFGFSTVNINEGGYFASDTPGQPGRTSVSHLFLELHEGGVLGREFQIGQDAHLVVSGGMVGGGLDAGFGSEVTVLDGYGSFYAHAGSQIDISGGTIRLGARNDSLATISGGLVSLDASLGSTIDISGGNFRPFVHVFDGSRVTLSGGEFQLDSLPISHLDGGLPEDSVFAGTLADGSVFVFDSHPYFPMGPRAEIAPLTTSLHNVPLPPADPTPITVNSGEGPRAGLRQGQSMTLTGSGSLPDHFAAVGAELRIAGGVVGGVLTTYQSNVTISGGLFDEYAEVFLLNGTVLVSGGEIPVLNISDKSVAEITGGSGQFTAVSDHSTVDVSGGNRNSFWILDGSSAVVSGGVIGRCKVLDSSQITYRGGEFQLDGLDINSLDDGLQEDQVFTGTLSDGSVFVFSDARYDRLPAGSVVLESADVPPLDTTPIFVASGVGPATGLRAGQSLTLLGMGSLPENFAAVHANLYVLGGTVGDGLKTAYTDVFFSGGSIGSSFSAFNSRVNIDGASVGNRFRVHKGTHVNISRGTVSELEADDSTVHIVGGIVSGLVADNSIVNISDGTVHDLSAHHTSTVSIFGGQVDGRLSGSGSSIVNLFGGRIDHFDAFGRVNIYGGRVDEMNAELMSTVNLHVTELWIDSMPIQLVPGDPYLIEERGGALLEAVLADGSPLDFELWSVPGRGADYFARSARLFAIRVPEPSGLGFALLALVALWRSRDLADQGRWAGVRPRAARS